MSIVAITYLAYLRHQSCIRDIPYQRQASQWARRKKETMRRERMTAEYCENRSIFCKNLSTSIDWLGSSSNLATLTSRANLRMSTEVSDSSGKRDKAYHIPAHLG